VNVTCPECRSMFRVDPAKVPSAGVRARCSVCGGVITIGAGTSIDEEFDSSPTLTANPAASATPIASRAPVASSTPVAVEPHAVEARERPTSRETPSISKPTFGEPSPAPTRRQTPPVSQPAGIRPPPFARAPLTPPASVPGIPRPATGPSVLPPIPPARSPLPNRPSGLGPLATARPNAQAATPPIGPSASAPREAAPPAAPNSANRPAAPARTPINPFLANDPNAKARRLSRALVSDLVTYFPQRRDEGLRDGTLRELFSDEIKKSYEEYVDQVGKELADSTTHFQDALNEILAAGRKVF
jgi:predicted Zn finger-like uncharacterized protein